MMLCEICKREKATFLIEVEYSKRDYEFDENFKTCGKCCEVLEEFNNVSDSFTHLKIIKLKGDE